MKRSRVYYDLFLRYGDPMCLLLAKDFEKTENLRKEINTNKNQDLTL